MMIKQRRNDRGSGTTMVNQSRKNGKKNNKKRFSPIILLDLTEKYWRQQITVFCQHVYSHVLEQYAEYHLRRI